jgi:glyoxylase-like metal-dependent hydrolase (beta-lactamase superfamily II)
MTSVASIRVRCGAWYPAEPAECLICTDEREAVAAGGQRWTRSITLQANHRNVVRELEPGLSGGVTSPAFAIAQQLHLVAWAGEMCQPVPGRGLTLIRCGGHVPGSHVLHWPAGAVGPGVLLTGDTISVTEDRRWVTFMYNYPNSIPLGPQAITRILAALAPYPFDRLYGSWPGAVVAETATAAVQRFAARFLARATH